MFERATREWPMSPTRPMVSPSIRPLARRMVKRSSSPWVGCSWAPSPALMIEAPTCCASKWGAPGLECRTTITSAPIASMFLAVSMKVSPLDRLDTPALKSWTSAESCLAARLKLVRVRVEFSKNRLKTMRPWSAGTFFRLRVEISVNDSAVSRIATISSRESSSRPSKCLRFQVIGGAFAWSAVMSDTETPSLGRARNLPSRQPDDLVLRIDRADPDPDALVARGRHFEAHDVGLDGELA